MTNPREALLTAGTLTLSSLAGISCSEGRSTEAPPTADDMLVVTDTDELLDIDGLDLVVKASITGTSGNDDLFGTSSADTIWSGAGSDTVNGLQGNDKVYGGQQPDTLSGGSGNDTLYGEHGADSLRGNGDNDVIYGGSHADTLKGENGNDTLRGQSGDDDLNAGDGTNDCGGDSGPGCPYELDDCEQCTTVHCCDINICSPCPV